MRTFTTCTRRGYERLSDLAARSEAALTFTAGTATIETIADLPFTITSALVTTGLPAGTAPGTVIRIRQSGRAGQLQPSNGPRLLVRGRNYAAALMRFHLQPGDDTGQWVIVGDGLWQDQGAGELRLDAADSALPAMSTLSALGEAWRA
ncbi:hypothetical protein [Kineococcus sp. SYSU DK005]|uniref:hypothetical protein n=1 Tax=Kineococcus sp. SYSU DK005 TaxID=3383126 RepID=UPI003D7DAA54